MRDALGETVMSTIPASVVLSEVSTALTLVGGVVVLEADICGLTFKCGCRNLTVCTGGPS